MTTVVFSKWRRTSFAAAVALLGSTQTWASSPNEAMGLWMTEQKDAVIEFANCPDHPEALCGQIVWDKDAGTPADTCGVRIAQLSRFERDAWRDGWIYDPRDKKHYKGTVRRDGETLKLRAFIGVEVLGETEYLVRVSTLPASPACKK